MKKRERATLVLKPEGASLLDWEKSEATDSRVIPTWNLNLLKESLHLAIEHVDVEVKRVVFDQSIDAEEWLEFLSAMPLGFRGDVLFVVGEDKAFLSAVGRADERVIYKLNRNDLEFYLRVSGIEPRESYSPRHEAPQDAQVLAVAV
ncbi:MAG: hypothetical protein R3338_09480 [Thermoanaerobaculia bacterium]|nr:hypothetical protein [Thermoanaerobaculia bacterium]